MMFLTEKIEVKIEDKERGLSADRVYPVIGTAVRSWLKDGKKEVADCFIVINDRDEPVFIFPSKCYARIIKREEKSKF
jgi:hypothetical protein